MPATTYDPVEPASLRVLIVEDCRTLRRLISGQMASRGIDVTVACNGREALELVGASEFAGNPFDVVLMDVMMPELDGVHATWMLRRKGFKGAIVIATAADEKDTDLARALCAGADEYLPKPYGPDDLLALLSRPKTAIAG